MKPLLIIGWITTGLCIGLLFTSFSTKPTTQENEQNFTPQTTHRRTAYREKRFTSNFKPFSASEITARINAFGKETNPLQTNLQLAYSLTQLSDAEIDEEYLLTIFQEADQPNNFLRHVKILFSRLGRTDPQRAMHLLSELKHFQLRHAALKGSIEGWAESNPDECWSFLKDQPSGFIRDSGIPNFLQVLAKRDPIEALQHAMNVQGNYHMESVMKTWMRHDQEAAVAHVMNNDDLRSNKTLLEATIEGLASKDRGAALELALSLSKEEDGDAHVSRVVSGWVGREPTAALTVFNRLPADNLNSNLIKKIAFALALNSLLDQAMQLAPQIPTGELKDSYWQALVTARSWDDPADAAQLAKNLPEGKQRNEALRQLMNSWATKDERGASEWLNTLPDSPSRDVAVSAFSYAIFELDPEQSALWASSIRNENEREQRLNKVLQRWKEIDHEAAEAWAESSN